MRNLKLLFKQECQVEPNSTCFTVDNETAKFYLAGSEIIKGYSLENFEECFDVNLSAHNFYPDPNSTVVIVGIEYLCGEEQLCVALQNGDILLCGTANKEVEIVGTLECEIDVMSWSPDQEIVLFLTNKGTAVAMNHDFDPLIELEVGTSDFGEGGFVNVGWGSKETQFQGSAGKIVPGKEKKLESAKTLYDDQETKVVWRGDGQYFAVSTIVESQRKFRIWNRQCELQYTSEILPGLESCFAWKPSGSLIATSQRKVHRHDIVFFELNGLQHGEFTLPFQHDQVCINRLEWNSDSSILAISATDVHTKQHFLQLWTVSNYHWSLKYSLELPSEIVYFKWDLEHMYNLHVIAQNGLYTLFTWSWCVYISKLSLAKNENLEGSSCVCVVDGDKLKVTPFRHVTIPPPMCAFQYQFKENINCVCFLENSSRDAIGVLLNDGSFFSIENTKSDFNADDVVAERMAAGGNGYTSQVAPLVVTGRFQPIKSDVVSFDWWKDVRHLLWNNNETLTAVVFHKNTDFLLTFSMNKTTFELTCIEATAACDCIVSICSGEQANSVLVQLKNGEVLEHSNSEFLPYCCSNGAQVCFGYPCSDMQLCKLQQSPDIEAYGVVARSFQNRLFFNNTLISSECTSFFVHEDYLMFTTSSHKLCFISKCTSVLDLEKPKSGSDSNLKNVRMFRSVERGARLIVVTPNDTKTIMQLPRGNLEIIHPRPLVLSLVKYDLDHGNYRDAFILMRKHRINLNLIHDHNPSKFLENINYFIKDLNSVDYLNLFLSELQENDVSLTMYAQFYPSKNAPLKSLLAQTVSKVSVICEAILSELRQLDSVKYFLSVLTAYVRKPTPEIEQALSCLKSMKAEKFLNESQVNDALRHLHVMVDGRILYQEALATYDLDLALTVAQVSNNDPKEYVPFLNELREMEENLKRYKIDVFLRKYNRALVNISKCPENFSECTDLVKSHSLHREALALFKRFTPEFNEISNLYAEVLTAEHKYDEAGIILARCGNHKRAIKCFTMSGDWQLALSCASSLQYSTESYRELAKSLADNLVSKSKYCDAAILLEEVADFEGAVDALLKGKLWANALRVIRLHKLRELVDTRLVLALKQACDDFKLNMQSYTEQFDKHFNRLLIVREIKREKAMQVIIYPEILL